MRSARQAEVFQRLIALTLERGFAGYTLEQAAIVLRCSKSTIYALAGSREQLIRAVVVAFFRGAAERVEERVAAEIRPGAPHPDLSDGGRRRAAAGIRPVHG